MENNKIKVTNVSNSPAGIYLPEIRFRHMWQPGSSFYIEKEVLEQLLYYPGVKYAIDNGILYIEDLTEKQELGLEPEDATEPVNIIVLSDKERRNYMTIMPFDEFKEKVKALSLEQIGFLIDYAIDNHLLDFEKNEFLKELTGRDIIGAVRLKKMNQEG